MTTPRLVITVPIEGIPVVRVVASSLEDEQRILGWARRALVVAGLGELVLRALGEAELLDDRDPWQPPS